MYFLNMMLCLCIEVFDLEKIGVFDLERKT